MKDKVALITGITGQDGSYLAELLLKKDYDVHGIVRRSSQHNRSRIEGIRDRARQRGRVFELYYGDLCDSSSLNRIVSLVEPTEVYNLAAQSHVRISFDQPEFTADVTGTGVLRLLEAIRINKLKTRFYQASTSELYGLAQEKPQTERTPFYPRNPYGVAKLYGFWIVKNYRESYGIHASNGILFNHESPRRGENFVTRKITYSLARIKHDMQQTLFLGNPDAQRDWGFAGDYVEAMWRMLQLKEPEDFVIATGQMHTVRSFVEKAAALCDFDLAWEGSQQNEIGRDTQTGKVLVKIDPRFYRPAEVDELRGDATKAREKLGWQPKVSFEELVRMMMESDLKLVEKQKRLLWGP